MRWGSLRGEPKTGHLIFYHVSSQVHCIGEVQHSWFSCHLTNTVQYKQMFPFLLSFYPSSYILTKTVYYKQTLDFLPSLWSLLSIFHLSFLANIVHYWWISYLLPSFWGLCSVLHFCTWLRLHYWQTSDFLPSEVFVLSFILASWLMLFIIGTAWLPSFILVCCLSFQVGLDYFCIAICIWLIICCPNAFISGSLVCPIYRLKLFTMGEILSSFIHSYLLCFLFV